MMYIKTYEHLKKRKSNIIPETEILKEKNKKWKDNVEKIRKQKIIDAYKEKMNAIEVRRKSMEDVYFKKVMKDIYHKKMLDKKEIEEDERRKYKQYITEYNKYLQYEKDFFDERYKMIEEKIKEENMKKELRKKAYIDKMRQLKKETYKAQLKEIERKCDLRRQLEEKY